MNGPQENGWAKENMRATEICFVAKENLPGTQKTYTRATTKYAGTIESKPKTTENKKHYVAKKKYSKRKPAIEICWAQRKYAGTKENMPNHRQ